MARVKIILTEVNHLQDFKLIKEELQELSENYGFHLQSMELD